MPPGTGSATSVFGPDPPPTLEMLQTEAAAPAAYTRPAPEPYDPYDEPAFVPPIGPPPGRDDDFDDDDVDFDDDRWDADPEPLMSRRAVFGLVGLAAVLLMGTIALLVFGTRDNDHAAEAGPDSGIDVPATSIDEGSTTSSAPSTTTSPSSTTSTSTTSTTTTSTTTTTVPDPGTVVPPVTTSTPPPTTRPTTTTTAPPAGPVIDAFNVQIDAHGCGAGSSPAHFSWSTSRANRVTLGQVGGSQSNVALDGTSQTCVRDSGETWRLTATGPGGTTTRDLVANP
jgi:hypothetical protein